MTNTPQQPPAGWYPDPAGSGGERFWDGGAWSQSTRDKTVPEPAPGAPTSAPSAPHSYGSPSPYGAAAGGGQQYGGYAGYGGYADYGPQLPRRAGFWWRFLGYVIDGILLAIASQIVASMLGFNAALNRATEAWTRELLLWSENPESMPFPMPGDDFMQATWAITAVTAVIWILYRIGMYAWKNATLGMMAVGVKLVKSGDWEGELPMGTKVLRAVVSTILYNITLVGLINGIFAAFSSKKQTLGDMIARTEVIKIR